MPEKTFAEVALRVAAVIIAADYLQWLPALAVYLRRPGLPDAMAPALIAYGLVLLLILGFVLWLWFFPGAAARRLGLAGASAIASPRYAWLEGSLLTVIGVYLATTALVDASARMLVEIHRQVQPRAYGAGYASFESFVRPVLQLAFGIALSGTGRLIPLALRRLRRSRRVRDI